MGKRSVQMFFHPKGGSGKISGFINAENLFVFLLNGLLNFRFLSIAVGENGKLTSHALSRFCQIE